MQWEHLRVLYPSIWKGNLLTYSIQSDIACIYTEENLLQLVGVTCSVLVFGRKWPFSQQQNATTHLPIYIYTCSSITTPSQFSKSVGSVCMFVLSPLVSRGIHIHLSLIMFLRWCNSVRCMRTQLRCVQLSLAILCFCCRWHEIGAQASIQCIQQRWTATSVSCVRA